MIDAKIISAVIASRESYNAIAGHVDVDEFSPVCRFWWKQIEDWYTHDSRAKAVDSAILLKRGLRDANPKSRELLREWYEDLPPPPSPANVAKEFLELKRITKWNQLQAAIQAQKPRMEVLKLSQEHTDLLKATSLKKSELIQAKSVWDLSEELGEEKRIPIFPKQLNVRCKGGALPGHHWILFARTEMGKTCFAVNATAGWIKNGYHVTYIGNEDSIDIIKDRVRWNLSNMTEEQINANEDTIRIANERAVRHGIEDRLSMYHLHPGNPYEIQDLIDDCKKPQILVLDQIRNIESSKGQQDTTARLNQVAIDVRQLLSKNKMVGLSIGQARDADRPKMWLVPGDYDSSRTGTPAQADLMTGLGWDPDELRENERAVSICKNKIGGRKDGFIATMDFPRSKVK